MNIDVDAARQAAPLPTLGILLLNTRFRRYQGDIGNPATWPFPVRYRVVEQAEPRHMGHLAQHDLLAPFQQAAQALIDDGVVGIVTSCGYLAYYQQELAAWSPVPVATSSLLQYGLIRQLLPANRYPLILTFDESTLTGDYLQKVGIPPQAAVAGVDPRTAFVRAIRQGEDDVPYQLIRHEVLSAAQQALARFPAAGALLLECTNLAPFSAELRTRFGLPVFDAVTLVNGFYAALRPPVWDGGASWNL
ncbi:aspartate/glutamate racemase family protein [Brenneria sp. g21c3]|uniref:aspartate/glutamate racemase family protein n=1 Tax=Brenneria sp. g21c3 TaxID=3093893 RepID=UPI002EC41670|nr:aspartate/glutamate racemase family protein [Brenneria sp. g21c3]